MQHEGQGTALPAMAAGADGSARSARSTPCSGTGLPAIAAGAEVAFVCDERGLVVEASDAISRLLGRPVEALRGEPLARLVANEQRAVVRHGLSRARRDGASAFEVSFPAGAGAPVQVALAAWAVTAHGGQRAFCVATSGAPARPRAEDRAQCLADTQKVIATILRLALEELPLDQLLGRTLDLILSIPWLSIERTGAIFLVEDDPAVLVMKTSRGLRPALLTSCARVPFGRCLCGLAAASHETVYTSELDHRHTTRYAGIAAHGHYCVPIHDGDATLGVITTYLAPGHERSEVEVEFLRAVADTLAGVILRRRVDAERRRAERASSAKSELLALVSHELLTPVTAVMLSCERLERDRATRLAPRHAEIVCRMEGALARLASTIRMLLEHARVDGVGPAVHPAAVDLAALVTHVVEEVRPLAERKGLTLRLALESPLPALWTDAQLLRVVLANLASNAVKFTDAGSVAVRVDYRDAEHHVAVSDTGPGIPEAERARLFEPFEPLEPLANKHVPGLGLGLALARRLAHALGARLVLEPAAGAGSTFVLTLPALV